MPFLSASDLRTRGLIHGTGTTTIRTGPARVFGIYLTAASGATGTITVYDNTSAAGDNVVISGTAGVSNSFLFPPNGRRFNTGIHVVVTGAPAYQSVTYMVERD